MSIERGGWLMDIFFGGGIGEPTKSITRCTRCTDVVRMKALGHMGIDFEKEYYGDTMTWDEITSAGLTFGTSTLVKYPNLKDGWTYYYDAVGKIFTVTDDVGNAIREKMDNIADMGIVWNVLSSHQFKIYYSAEFINDAFLIAWIKKKGFDYDDDGNIIGPDYPEDNTSDYPDILLSRVDPYCGDVLHWRCNRMTLQEVVQGRLENNLQQQLREATKIEILRSKVPVRSTTGGYTKMAWRGPDEMDAASEKKRNAIVEIVLGEFLMIAFFASIKNMSKPVYEPWMLWGLWQWLGSGEPMEFIERIFDLSPRW